jgi:hypothetical protein
VDEFDVGFNGFRVNIFTVGQFVFVFKSARDIKISVRSQAALITGAYSGKSVPIIFHHNFRGLLGLIVISHHHMSTVNDNFSFIAIASCAGFVNDHMHIFHAFPDGSVPVSQKRRIHGDGGRRFG